MPSDPIFGINKNFVYQDIQRAVFCFHNNASSIMSLLAVPVPYPYFHIVKIMRAPLATFRHVLLRTAWCRLTSRGVG